MIDIGIDFIYFRPTALLYDWYIESFIIAAACVSSYETTYFILRTYGWISTRNMIGAQSKGPLVYERRKIICIQKATAKAKYLTTFYRAPLESHWYGNRAFPYSNQCLFTTFIDSNIGQRACEINEVHVRFHFFCDVLNLVKNWYFNGNRAQIHWFFESFAIPSEFEKSLYRIHLIVKRTDFICTFL